MANEVPAQQSSLRNLSQTITLKISKGATQESMVQELIGQGWPEVTAKSFVVNASRAVNKHRRIGSEDRLVKAKARILRGLLWFIAGLAILLISLGVPNLKGGIPLLYVGAIVVGFFDFFIGLLNWYQEQE
jgi:hypothetical protein